MKLRDKDMESKKVELTNDEYELIFAVFEPQNWFLKINIL